jgi:hypothetical protein
MSEEETKEEKYQVISVFANDINKKKFVLNPGEETVMILEEDGYETSE